jgi:hypothetical protein
MTYRQARPWLKRSDVRIGVMPCGTDIRWLQEDDERQSYVAQLRHAEGRDCNVAGDVLLYRIADSVKVLVVEGRTSGRSIGAVIAGPAGSRH